MVAIASRPANEMSPGSGGVTNPRTRAKIRIGTTRTVAARLKPCERCGGKLHAIEDRYEKYTQCRICGRTYAYEAMLETDTPHQVPAIDERAQLTGTERPGRKNLQECPVANEAIRRLRWLTNPRCPACRREGVSEIKGANGAGFQCQSCQRYFTVRTGTLMEGSALTNRQWAAAFGALTEMDDDLTPAALASAAKLSTGDAADILARMKAAAQIEGAKLHKFMTRSELRRLLNARRQQKKTQKQGTGAQRAEPEEPAPSGNEPMETNEM